MKSHALPVAWIRELAAPYLRGYRPRVERRGSLRGYWFTVPLRSRSRQRAAVSRRIGFFVGYLMDAEGFEFLQPAPPECLVFAFVQPVGGVRHRKLVAKRGALLPATFEYVRWLTHRPPRFVFHADAPANLARHFSMRDWPRGKWQHYSRNFFIETLAWLVRSGLVRKLLKEANVSRN